MYVDGFKLELHFGKGEDGLGFVVVARGAPEAAQEAGALCCCAALRVVCIHVTQQVQLWHKKRELFHGK